MICSRVKTCRGCLARKASSSNSRAVSLTSAPRRAHLTGRYVDLELAELQHLGAGAAPAAAQHGADASHELAGRERLRHIIVGPELETDDPIALVTARRQQDHGDGPAPADLPAQLEAADAWQHHVEHDELRRLAFDEPAHLAAVAGLTTR